MKVTVIAFVFALAFCLTGEIAFCAKSEMKKVTRIEIVTVVRKGRKLVVRADGMAPTTMRLIGDNGELRRHNPEHKPNADGLLEYDLLYAPPRKDRKQDKFESVRGTLTEESVPEGVKGALVYAEFNQLKGLIEPPKEKKKRKAGSFTSPSPSPSQSPNTQGATPSPSPL